MFAAVGEKMVLGDEAGAGCRGQVMWGAGHHGDELRLPPIEGLQAGAEGCEFMVGQGLHVPRPGVPRACTESSSGDVQEICRSHLAGKG